MESIIIINAFVPNGKASSNKTQVYITKGKNKFIIMDKDFHIPPLVIHRTFLNNKKKQEYRNFKNSVNQPNTATVFKYYTPKYRIHFLFKHKCNC